jgi:hypothetical protein
MRFLEDFRSDYYTTHQRKLFMKKTLIAFGLLLGSVAAHADDNIKLVNADNSPLGELCISAVSSPEGLDVKAKELGISSAEIASVYCNGKPIRQFVSQFRASDEPITAYVISAANQAPETQICLAALTSGEEFARLKEAHFSAVKDVEKEITCNNMSLGQFVRKYRAHLAEKATVATASR